MRVTLGLTVAACLLLAALLAWLVRVPRMPRPEARDAIARTPRGESSQPTPDQSPSPASPSADASVAAATPAHVGSDIAPARGPVRWADDRLRERAVRQVSRASSWLAPQPASSADARPAATSGAARPSSPFPGTAEWDEARSILESLVQSGQWDDALALAGQLVAADPDDASARFVLSTILMRLRLWAQALEELGALTALAPDSPSAWFNRAVAEGQLGRLHEAATSWDRCLGLAPDHVEALARRGALRLDLERWSAAAADFQAVLALSPDALDAKLNLALAWRHLGRYDEAYAVLRDALVRHPRNVPALNRMADLCWLLYRGDPDSRFLSRDEAAAWCRQSLAIDPAQPDVAALLVEIERDHGP